MTLFFRSLRLRAAFSLSIFFFLGGCSEGAIDVASKEEERLSGGGQGSEMLGTGGAAGVASGSGGQVSGGGGLTGSGGLSETGGSPPQGAGGRTPEVNPGDYIFPDGRGARVSFKTYEAEEMDTNGELLGPTRDFGQVASEASGRRAVRLHQQGDYVSFVNQATSNSVVVRYSIPDNGENYWTKLTVLVDDVERAKLDVTSRYSWSYRNDKDNIFNKPEQNNPGSGTGHHFDETRALVGDIPIGSKVTVRKSPGDGAAHYDIDLVEMEQVAEPLPQPAGFRSIVDCGATNNGDQDDDTWAIQQCLDDPGAGVYIPPGVFYVKSDTLEVANTEVRGAGMWHSTIMGYRARFACWNHNCRYYDFSVFGDTTARYDSDPDVAFDGSNNNGVVLENIWVEHRRVGYWVSGGGDGIVIRGSRFRNLHADGVNFYGHTRNSVIENSHFRNTGDDAIAQWSHDSGGRPAGENNTYRHNYIQLPWKANCFGIYGGSNTKIEDNVCADVLQYPGVLLGRQFDSHAFGGLNSINRNTLLRTGGRAYGARQGALKFSAQQGPIDHIRVNDLDIIDSTYFGIQIQGEDYVGDTVLDNVSIQNPGDGGFFLMWGSKGALDASNVSYSGGAAPIVAESGANFSVNKVGDGNTGW